MCRPIAPSAALWLKRETIDTVFIEFRHRSANLLHTVFALLCEDPPLVWQRQNLLK
jgi:hypothetical protein